MKTPSTPQFLLADPTTLSREDWEQVKAILGDGEAVNLESALREIPRAPVFAIGRVLTSVIGIAAIKRPRPNYAAAKMKDAHFEFDPQMNELGYVAIHPDHKGNHYSGQLVDAVVAAFNKPLFSTTDSREMKFTLGNRGFVQRGCAWQGERGELTLWLRMPSL